MAEEANTPDVARFEKEEHNVTCCLEALFCGKAILILGEDEVEFTSDCLGGICNIKKRGPYGELGTVDSSQCLCFHGFSISSFMTDDDMKCTGCGCEADKVDAIVKELKKRQAFRGDRAKTRMAESTIASLNLLHKKVDALMEKMEVSPITAADEMER